MSSAVVRVSSTLADQAHEKLRMQLLAGEFTLGEPLAEEATAVMLGMSRTPVREALRRLAAEELLIVGPSGGYRPNPPDMSRMRQLYEVRLRLEQLSVELACMGDADRDVLEPLRDQWRSMRLLHDGGADFVHQDESFHVQICKAGGNHVLVSMLRQINDRIRIIRVHDFLVPARLEATVIQHLAILDAILGRKVRVASQRMQAHIEESASLVEDRATKAMLRMLRRPVHAE